MALPAITKTWTFDVNNSLPTTGNFQTDTRRLALDLKNYLVSSGWTVKGSSNSSTAAMDGVDRWITTANVVWTSTGVGGPHSWIVLSAPVALSPTLEIMFSCWINGGTSANLSHMYAYIYSSWTGFSGGNTTTNPTASTYVAHCAGGWNVQSQWRGVAASEAAFSCVWHGMSATDGTARIVVCSGNTVMMHWNFDKLLGSYFVDPSMVFIANGNQYTSAYTHWNDSAVFYNYSTAANAAFYLTAEGYGAAMIGQNITSQNDLGGGYWMGAVGIASTTGGFRGRHGTIGDLWWGTTGVGYGSTIPDDGTKQFAQFNDMIFPWNGTTPLIA